MSLIRQIVVFLSGVVSLGLCVAQIMLPGACPNISGVQNFEAEKYLGKWYEVAKYFAIFQVGGKCVTAVYGDLGDGRVSVKNTEINTLKGNQKISIDLVGNLVDPNVGYLAVSFPYASNFFSAPYNIVDTDYTSYALIYGCQDLGIFNFSFSWILTRERNPSNETVQKAYDAADKNGIDKSYFITTDQNNCPDDSEQN